MTTLTPEIARLLVALRPYAISPTARAAGRIYLSALAHDSDTETLADLLVAALRSVPLAEVDRALRDQAVADVRSVEA